MRRLLRKETIKFLHAFTHPTIIYLTLVGNSVLFAATLATYFIEKDMNPDMGSYFDYLWWGVYTITTVGYGDILPVTFTGRVIGIFLMYAGSVMFITFTGAILTILMREEVSKELDPIEREVREGEREQVRIEQTLEKILVRIENIEKQIRS